jgi:hypothetical protein
MRFWFWIRNLPWHLCEILICDLFGHKPMVDILPLENLTICGRCMAPLKKDVSGQWTGQLALADLRGS